MLKYLCFIFDLGIKAVSEAQGLSEIKKQEREN